MGKLDLGRLIAIAIGVVVLFGLELGWGAEFYIAIPAAIIAYTAARVASGLLLGAGEKA